jgi:hypothetical protein
MVLPCFIFCCGFVVSFSGGVVSVSGGFVSVSGGFGEGDVAYFSGGGFTHVMVAVFLLTMVCLPDWV